jgi:hypothetical protein
MDNNDSMSSASTAAEAQLFAKLIDDLLADKEPSLVDDNPAEVLDPLVCQDLLRDARVLKGALDPSEASEEFKIALRVRSSQQVREMKAAPAMTVDELLAVCAPDLATRTDISTRTGLSREDLGGLVANTLSPFEVPVARLLLLADALRIPGQTLLDAVRASATRWVEPLVRERSARSPGLAYLAGHLPLTRAADVRQEISDELNEYAASLERELRTSRSEQSEQDRL